MRGRERGQPFCQEKSELYLEGVPPPPLFIGGGGSPRGCALGFPSLGLRQGGRREASWKPPQGALPSWAPLAQVIPPHLGLPSEREPIYIKFINLIPKPFRNT